MPDDQGRRDEDRRQVTITPLRFDAQQAGVRPEIGGLIGASPKMTELVRNVTRASQFDYDILLVGPTGTGKTVLARALHALSKRRGGPFVEINSAAFQDELIESELFGHEKGAFTGAAARRIGKFEQAHGGIIFFDEIGDMPLPLQAKVLKVFEEKKVTRLGGNTPVPCDVQIICATFQPLVQLVEEGRVRLDFFQRINNLRIAVPSLAERREDIPELVTHFLASAQEKYQRPEPFKVEGAAMQLLQERDWPGNVRELEKAVQRLVVEAFEADEIMLEHVLSVTSATLGQPPVGERDTDLKYIYVPPFRIGDSLALYVSRVILYIYNTLIKQTGNHSRVAKLLNTDRNALYQLLKRHAKRLTTANESAVILTPPEAGHGGEVSHIEDRREPRRMAS